MIKEEFEKGYCERSEITLEEYHKYLITLPCHCDYKDCKGWAAINNDPRSINTHNDLYNR